MILIKLILADAYAPVWRSMCQAARLTSQNAMPDPFVLCGVLEDVQVVDEVRAAFTSQVQGYVQRFVSTPSPVSAGPGSAWLSAVLGGEIAQVCKEFASLTVGHIGEQPELGLGLWTDVDDVATLSRFEGDLLEFDELVFEYNAQIIAQYNLQPGEDDDDGD